MNKYCVIYMCFLVVSMRIQFNFYRKFNCSLHKLESSNFIKLKVSKAQLQIWIRLSTNVLVNINKKFLTRLKKLLLTEFR